MNLLIRITSLFLMLLGIGASSIVVYGQAKIDLTRPRGYEFNVGLRVGMALAEDNISVFVGKIDEVTETSAVFSVTERLFEQTPGINRLILTKPRESSRPSDAEKFFPRLTTEYSKGKDLIVFHVGGEKGELSIAYATSYTELFDKIRTAVQHQINVRNNTAELADTSKIAELSRDPFFRGYIARYVDMRSRDFPDFAALILSRLFKEGNIPGSTAFMSLSGFLSNQQFHPIKQETRDKVFNDVISVAIGKSESARTAVIILIEAVNKGARDELKTHLTQGIRAELLREFKMLPPPDKMPPHKRSEFEALLSLK